MTSSFVAQVVGAFTLGYVAGFLLQFWRKLIEGASS